MAGGLGAGGNVPRTSEDLTKPKFYALIEFPLSIRERAACGGYPCPYTALDIVARKRRMLGLQRSLSYWVGRLRPAHENYAIKNKIHPRIVTERTLPVSKQQLKSLGFSL